MAATELSEKCWELTHTYSGWMDDTLNALWVLKSDKGIRRKEDMKPSFLAAERFSW